MYNVYKISFPQFIRNFLLPLLIFISISTPKAFGGANELPPKLTIEICSPGTTLILPITNKFFAPKMSSANYLSMMADTDGDGVLDTDDIDDDNDGVPDTYEYCSFNNFFCFPESSDPSEDSDGDGIPNFTDATTGAANCLDANGDGVCDQIYAQYDSDGDNVPDHLDLDGDNDGISDLYEVGHGAPDVNGDGIIDGLPAEFGQNGLYNGISNDPDDPNTDIAYTIRDGDNDDIPDHDDLDVDHDGGSDIAEAGYFGRDLNNDGRADNTGNTPSVGITGIPAFQDPAFTGVPMQAPPDTDGDGIEDYRDLDSDNDGISDVIENNFNNDPDNDGMLGGSWEPAAANGFPESNLVGTFQTTTSNLVDIDGDGYFNYIDLDSDNDGIHDIKEGTFFNDPDNNGLTGSGIPAVDSKGKTNDFHSSFEDKDADGFANFMDLDSDNDGVNDVIEAGFFDANNDGFIGDGLLTVSNLGLPISDATGNLIATSSNVWELDFDWIVNYLELDSDNDGINDVEEAGLPDPDNDGHVGSAPFILNDRGQIINPVTTVAYATSYPKDFDGDGDPDMFELDSDNDGIPDTIDSEISDNDNNGIAGQGAPNINSWGQPIFDNFGTGLGSTSFPPDTDGDGFPNYNDIDSDGDGDLDANECPQLPCTDFEPDNIPEFLDTECNVFLEKPIVLTNAFVCENEMITLQLLEVHGSWINAGSNIVYTWRNGNGTVLGNSNIAVSIPANGQLAVPPYTFEVSIPNCTSAISQPIEVGVNSLPQPQATNSGMICPGENATLFAESIQGASYQWRIQGNPNIFSTAQNPVVFNVTQNTVYELTVISNSCQSIAPATTSVQILATPTLNPDYNYTINALDCSPEQLTLFTNSGVGNSPVVSASWIGPGLTSQQFNPVISNPTSANNGVYQVTIEDQNGCTATQSIQVTEIIDSPQPPQISPIGNNCQGTQISLSATNYPGNSVSYTWQTPGGTTTNISGQNSSVLSIDPFDSNLHEGIYTVQVALNSCTMTSETYMLQQAQEPTTAPSVASTAVCEGQSLQLLSNSTNAVNWSWTGPGGFNSSNENPVIFNTSVFNNGLFTCTVTNSNGCTATESVMVTSIQQKPAFPNTSNNSPICEGGEINLCTTTPYSGNSISFIWRNNNGAIIGNSSCISFSSNAPIAIPPYTLQVTVDDCISDFSAPIEVVETTSSLPPMTAFVNSNPCVGESVQLFAATVPGASYEWRLAGSNQILYTVQNPVIPAVFTETTYEVTAITTSCLQEPVGSVTVFVSALPSVTNIIGETTYCEGADLLLEGISGANVGGNMSYTWTGPNNFSFSGTNPAPGPYALNISDLSAIQQGTYKLFLISSDGCESEVVEAIQVAVSPELTMPIIEAVNDQVCFGEDIQLSVNPYPGTDVTYEWRFNNGSNVSTIGSTAVPFFDVPAATEMEEGAYTVIVTVDGCFSPISLAQEVLVDGLTAAPVVENETSEILPACESNVVQLSTDAIQGASYQWFDPSGAPFSTLQNPILQDVTPADAGDYYVIISLGACPDVASEPTTVYVNETPITPNLEEEIEICEGGIAEINANNVSIPPNSDAAFYWFDAATGSVIDTTETASISLFDLEVGTTNIYLIYTINGCASMQSIASTIEVSPSPPTNAIAGADQALCNEVTYDLSAVPQTGITGTWTSPTGATIADPSNPNTTVSDLADGENIFVWAISNAVCTNFSRDSVFITVSSQSTDQADAGADISLCGGAATSLSAMTLTTATGEWTQSANQANDGVIIFDPTDPNTTIEGLEGGENYSFFWTLSSGACIDFDQDVVAVTVENEVMVSAVEDELVVNVEEQLSGINLVSNDNVAGQDFTFEIIDGTISGTIETTENGVMTYTPSADFIGTETFTYEICNNVCTENCATALVTIEVIEDDAECFVTAAITPNGDNKNDFLEIPCLVSFPNNQLMIFNRWGDKVFDQEKYQGDWDGDRNGKPLPAGTYFYILKFDIDSKKLKQGYFSIVK